ncbi:MAG: bifunctional (p)ppGpp synthetase/guanosine-3',5'-bis(diphosphate) 3'-pyrophosphohydrolase [Clostridia bacterium]|nr:bifunctional (p)ppGpp synthetase/guanosine-3',5'-bis(diphosphate) 3'-pyrophosphohydrolase [Clostridia bacterium]
MNDNETAKTNAALLDEIPDEAKKLFQTLINTGKRYDLSKIRSAYEYAAELHEGQFRLSGEKYISHPIAVAEIVAELELDTDSVCAALLHDTVEDCADKTDLTTLKKKFGQDVSELVDGLTKLSAFQFEDKEEAHLENLRKMFLAMSKDVRVTFIKLCDRLHNMRTLSAKPEEKRRTIALETMYVYAPLAHRLGMQKLKQELEKLSLQYLDAIGYEEVEKEIKKRYGQNKDFLDRAKEQIRQKLEENGMKFTLEGRVKSVYSIYKKMYRSNKSFDEIYDFYAIRVIVETELECYTALGFIHEMFKSMPGRFKDYISTPKPNNYRSLHTTVIGRDGIPFEVQIRTYEMHHVAEYGLAANWKYKTGATADVNMDQRLRWIQEIVEAEKDTRDPDEFIDALKIDIFQDEVFTFTPKGEVRSLPQGSTVIDFAYAIHSEIGNKMIGAKVNGMIVPIDHVLVSGEIVEILTTSSSKGPSRDWLKIVKTTLARNKIRQWFKKEQRTENIAVGKAEIDREFKKYGVPYTEAQRNEVVGNVAARVGISDAEDAYNAIGYGGITVSKLSGKLREEFERVVRPEVQQPRPQTVEEITEQNKAKHKKSENGVIIDGIDGVVVKFSKCCNPIPGDKIVGFVTKGFGVSIHRCDCKNVLAMEKDDESRSRLVSAEWDSYTVYPSTGFEAQLQVICRSSMTVIADIASTLADMHVNLLGMSMQQKQSNETIVYITVACSNTAHLDTIVSRLRSVRDVEEVIRN